MLTQIGTPVRVPKPRGQARRQGQGRPAGPADAAASDHKGQTGPQRVRHTLNRGGQRFVKVLSGAQC